MRNGARIYRYMFLEILLAGIFIFPSRNEAFQLPPIELTLLQSLDSPGVIDLAWSFDGKYLAAGYADHKIRVWNSDDWSVEATIDCESHYTEASKLTWAPGQSNLAVGCLEVSDLVEVITINENLTITKINSFDQSVAWSPDGSYIAVPEKNGEVSIFSPSFQFLYTIGEAIPLSQFPDTGGIAYNGLKWSPNSNYLATIGKGQFTSITIWDLQTREPIHNADFAYDITWSPDGNTFAMALTDPNTGMSTLETWVTAPLQMIGSTVTSDSYNYPITSSDNQYIVYCEKDALYVYDSLTLERIDLQVVPSEDVISCSIYAMAWSSNSLLAVAQQGGIITIWEIGSGFPPLSCTLQVATSGELITAISTANSTPELDTICLTDNATYTFTTAHIPLNALPAITSEITIIGNGATLTRQAGSPLFGFFEVSAGGNLTLENLTLSGGDVGNDTGGALVNEGGTVTLNNVTFTNNHAHTGGAIDNESGSLTLIDSTFENNQADYGGAIDNDTGGTLSISGSAFTSNTADLDGGAIHNDGGTLTVTDSTFTSNTAGRYGGALDNTGQAILSGSTFSGNSASWSGGAIR
ncbi:MAG: hypothetical protein F9K28_11315, partial [Bacteroidetes bacterium]